MVESYRGTRSLSNQSNRANCVYIEMWKFYRVARTTQSFGHFEKRTNRPKSELEIALVYQVCCHVDSCV